MIQLAGSVQIDVVYANASPSNDSKPRRPRIQYRRGSFGPPAHNHRVNLAQTIESFRMHNFGLAFKQFQAAGRKPVGDENSPFHVYA